MFGAIPKIIDHLMVGHECMFGAIPKIIDHLMVGHEWY
jgi:hypothetical protein